MADPILDAIDTGINAGNNFPSQAVDPQLAAMASGLAQNYAPPAPPTYVSTWLKNHPGASPAAARAGLSGASFDLFAPAEAALAATFPQKSQPNIIDKTFGTTPVGFDTKDTPVSQAPTWMQRYDENVANERGIDQALHDSHPMASFAGSVAGGILNPITLGMGAPTSFGGGIAQGAGIGTAYGAGSTIGTPGSLSDKIVRTGMGTLSGGVAGGGAYALGSLLRGAKPTEAAQTLMDNGVQPTIGQMGGGSGQRLEDAATSIPMFGDAIKDRQLDAMQQFDRAPYDNALEPLGIKLDPSVQVGNQANQKVSSAISDAYSKAYDGATVLKTQNVLDNLDSAANEAENLLHPDKVAQIRANVARLVTNKFDANGELPASALETAKDWFAEQARISPTASLADRAEAKAYGNVVTALKNGVAETDPDRAALLKAADTAYARYMPIVEASGSNNASANGGMFTPTQYGAALRNSDQTAHHLAFAQGQVPMQDYAQAGQQALTPTIPDSGTAMRSWFQHPLAGTVTAPAWALGRALYSKPGQALARAVIYGGGGGQIRGAMGQLPNALLPGLLAAKSSGGAQ